MKKLIRILVPCLGLIATQLASAQGTLYVSTLAQPSFTNAAVGSDRWVAQLFVAGSNPGGYTLDSVQLLMGQASGDPGGFSVSIHNTAGSPIFVGSSLGSLGGSDPLTDGLYTYDALNTILLLPTHSYWILATASTAVADGYYNWPVTTAGAGYIGNDGWRRQADYFYSTDGGDNWGYNGSTHPPNLTALFAVYATAVPEPATYALVGLGLVCLSFWRSNRRRENRNY